MMIIARFVSAMVTVYQHIQCSLCHLEKWYSNTRQQSISTAHIQNSVIAKMALRKKIISKPCIEQHDNELYRASKVPGDWKYGWFTVS